jgi:Flp pilus assembly protein TadD
MDLLRRAVAAQPDDVELRGRYGIALAADGEPAAAAVQFRAILEIGAEPPGVHSNLALALEAAGDTEGARWEAEAALRLDPDDPAARGVLERGAGGR